MKQTEQLFNLPEAFLADQETLKPPFRNEALCEEARAVLATRGTTRTDQGHTPGLLDTDGRHEIDITPNSGTSTVIRVIEVCKQTGPGTLKTLAFVPADEPEGEANAACFAAAPKLLEAAAKAVAAVESYKGIMTDEVAFALSDAKWGLQAATAAATGKEAA